MKQEIIGENKFVNYIIYLLFVTHVLQFEYDDIRRSTGRGGSMTTTLYAELGRRLKSAREACDLTQSKVATHLGMARELISYYENGTRPIDLLTLNKLSNLYGYPVEYFLSHRMQDDDEVALAFRSTGLSESDLNVLAKANEFLHNLDWLNKILTGRSES